MDIQARPLTLHPVPSGTHLGGAWKFKDTSWVIPEGSEPLWSAGGRGGAQLITLMLTSMVLRSPKWGPWTPAMRKKMQEEDISSF